MTTLTKTITEISKEQTLALAEEKSFDIDQVQVEPCNHGMKVHGIVHSHHVMGTGKKQYLLFEIQGLSLGFHARFSTFMNAALECKNPLDGSSTVLFLKDHIQQGMLISGEISINGRHKNLLGVTYHGMT